MIKLLVSIAGADFSHGAGQVVSLDKDLEARLIETGQAEAVKKTTKKVTASAK